MHRSVRYFFPFQENFENLAAQNLNVRVISAVIINLLIWSIWVSTLLGYINLVAFTVDSL